MNQSSDCWNLWKKISEQADETQGGHGGDGKVLINNGSYIFAECYEK